MDYTIDRFEGGYAILIDSDANKLDVLREALPEGAREGDSVRFDGVRFDVDERLTQERKEALQSRFDKLKRRK